MRNWYIISFSCDCVIDFVYEVESTINICFKVIDDNRFIDIKFFPLIGCRICQSHISQIFIDIDSSFCVDFVDSQTAHHSFFDFIPYRFFHKYRFFPANLPGRRSEILVFFTFICESIKRNIPKYIKIIYLNYDQSVSQRILPDSDSSAEGGIENGYNIRIF